MTGESNNADLSEGIWKTLLQQELEKNVKLSASKDSLEGQLKQMTSENVRLSATIDSLENQMKQMTSELSTYKEYELMLKKETALKDAEIDQLRKKTK